MQDCVYKQMQSRGWYAVEQSEPQKIQQVKQKYSVNA